MCGCITHTPGGSPFQIDWFDRRKTDRSWILQQYYEPHRYTYHQTCWRPMAYEACCYGPEPEITGEDAEKDPLITDGVTIEVLPEIEDFDPAASRQSK